MPEIAQESQNNNQPSNNNAQQDDLVRQIAERVWQLWQQELRFERERRGETRR